MSGIDWEHEITVWIRRADFDEIEARGDVVREQPALVDHVLVGYRSATNDEQRAAAVLLLPDRFEPDYHAVLSDFASVVSPPRHGSRHRALCKALCILERDWSAKQRYWDDLEACIARARQLGGAQGEQGQGSEAVVLPGHGFGSVRFGMSRDALIELLGSPSSSDEWENELDLEFESKGLSLTLVDGRLRTIGLSGAVLEHGVSIQHATSRSKIIRTPFREADAIERWGEPNNRARSTHSDGKRTTALGYAGIAFHFLDKTGALVRVALSV